jgi:hypothetical protein
MAAVDTKPEIPDKSKDGKDNLHPPALKDNATAHENKDAQRDERERSAKVASEHLGSVEIHTESGATVEIDKNNKPVKFEDKGKVWTSTDGKTFTNGADVMQLKKAKDGDYQLVVPPPEAGKPTADRASLVARNVEAPVVSPEIPTGKVNAEGFTQLSSDETKAMFEARAAAGEKFTFQKADVAPGQKGYYQVDAQQLTTEKYPNGLRVPTTESPIVVGNNVHFPDGSVIPAGTKLPNGIQLDGRTIKAPPDGIKLRNGVVLKDGMQLDGAAISGGQITNPNDWLLTRTKVDEAGNKTYDVYTPPNSNFGDRWKPVDGQPGQFSPRSVPTDMVFLPSGKFEIPTSWGTAKTEGPAFLAKYGDGDFNIITAKDLSETYKGTTDARSLAKLDEVTPKPAVEVGDQITTPPSETQSVSASEFRNRGIYGEREDFKAAIEANHKLATEQKDFNVKVDGIVDSKAPANEILDKLRAIAFSDEAKTMPSTNLMKLYTAFRKMGNPEDMLHLYDSTKNEEFKKSPFVREFLAAAYNANGMAGKSLKVVKSIEDESKNAANPRPDLMNGEVFGAKAKAFVIRQDRSEKLLSAIESGDSAKVETARAAYAIAYDLPENAPLPSAEKLKSQAHDELISARDTYTEGFKRNYEYYPGINAAYTNLSLGDLKAATDVADLTHLATVREGGLERGNYWTSMTMLESSLVGGIEKPQIDATIARIASGNKIEPAELKSTLDAWETRVRPALEKLQKDPAQGAEAQKMLERFNYAEAKLKDSLAKPTTAAKAAGDITPGDMLLQKSHYYRGMSVSDSEIVQNNFQYGGIITDTSIAREDRVEFGKLLNTPIRELTTLVGGDTSKLPASIDEHTRLSDIKGPEQFIAISQKLVRENFGNAAKNLEVIDSHEHDELYDKPIEAANEASGIPAGRKEREGYDSRTSLASEFAKGLGDCRHHAQSMQLLYDMWQGQHLNEFLRQADTAATPELREKAIAGFKDLERTQLRTIDVTVKVPIEVEKAYRPVRPDVDTTLPANQSFVAADKLNYLEDHTMNILIRRDEQGHLESARFADSFYNNTYHWADGAIGGLTKVVDPEKGDNVRFSGGTLNGVLGAENSQVPVTLELAPYSGTRIKNKPNDPGPNDPGLIFERGLPVKDFEMIKMLKDRESITSNLMALTDHVHETHAVAALTERLAAATEPKVAPTEGATNGPAEIKPAAKDPKPDEADKVYKPHKSFRSSEPAGNPELPGHEHSKLPPKAVLDAMSRKPNERTAGENDSVHEYLKSLGKTPEEARLTEAKVNEAIGKGASVTMALGLVLGLASSAFAEPVASNGKVTFGH